jgi:hypothetical protein
VSDGRPVITLGVPPYSSGDLFRPTCPIEQCATICDSDALYCVECGARLYLIESGKYAELHATAETGT